MNFPINFHIGNFEISSHLVFETLSFFIGYRYYSFLRSRQKDLIVDENRIWIIIGAAAGAFIFSRFIGIMENPSLIKENWLLAFGNKSIIGGLLGGLIGVELVKKWIGENHSSGDLFTLPLIVAIGIGRVGCFLAGLSDNTYGVETSLPWGIDLGDGIHRHPTNLYEIGFLVVLYFSLKKIRAEKLKSGAMFKLFMVSYLSFRFLIEFIKPNEFSFLSLSAIQIACIAGLIHYWKVIIFPKQSLYA
ncbi:MAG: diacylglyceryl transferase [Cyclobacteriaceae bacterium]|nr:diacylglyceryl transferase [Cyclobacteriaceae bacterium]